MMKAGTVEIGWTFVFQIMNTIVLLGLIFGIFYLIFRLPRRIKENKERLDSMEKALKEINEKLDRK